MLTVDFKKLQVEPGMKALDAGCGLGRHTLEFHRQGLTAIGMDLSLSDLRHTLFLLASLQPKPEDPPFMTLKGDALNLPFADEQFDRIICSEVLEHVTDPAHATIELVRVLKPGGIIAVSVPTPSTEWAFWFANDDYFNTPGGHVRIFSTQAIVRLLTDHGLEMTNIHFEHGFHTIYWWIRCVFGLHDENHFAIRSFQKILTYAMFSRPLALGEKLSNYIFPKSMVLYAVKKPSS